MHMKLYDKLIQQTMKLVKAFPSKAICGQVQGETCADSGDCNLILKPDTAYELGGGTLPAVSSVMFTSDRNLVPEDAICRIGPDLSEISHDIPYARLTLIRVAKNCFAGDEEAYADLRKMEYTRYHVNPQGYMMRISTANEREPVRISKKALKEGLSFDKVGRLFIKGYHSHPKVEAVKLIFITAEDFPYEALYALVHQGEQITQSLNQIFHNLVMDCSVCSLKPVCDEVEGMREMHQGFSSKLKNS